jgi:6-pyruvoyltetrahydropterin/6-carboxytetrahydropterin synthase
VGRAGCQTPNVCAEGADCHVNLDGVNVELVKEYRFEAAHSLPRVPAGHKCRRVHGHSYKVELAVSGPVDADTGWLVDFQVIDDAWAELFARFDHHDLNDVAGLENSTCENIAIYVWRAVKKAVPQLSAVTIWETGDSRCTYRGT